MIDQEFIVKENRRYTPSLSLLVLQSSAPMGDVKGGQFVNVKVPSTEGVMLRRPVSVCNVDYENNELWLLVKNLGRGSSRLCRVEAGERLSLLMPLGNGFSYPNKETAKVLLAGGGVGIAPLLYWGKLLKQSGFKPTFLLAGRTYSDLPMLGEYMRWGELLLTTEDGSLGVKGRITEHPHFSDDYDKVYCCGPLAMMQAVGKHCISRDIDCEVSLENKMACGLGACLCCVEDTKEDGNVCSCTHGPVFNINNLKWHI